LSRTQGQHSELFGDLDEDALRKLVHALLREGSDHIAVSRRGSFVDFDIRGSEVARHSYFLQI
jgi:hypothetical protein